MTADKSQAACISFLASGVVMALAVAVLLLARGC